MHAAIAAAAADGTASGYNNQKNGGAHHTADASRLATIDGLAGFDAFTPRPAAAIQEEGDVVGDVFADWPAEGISVDVPEDDLNAAREAVMRLLSSLLSPNPCVRTEDGFLVDSELNRGQATGDRFNPCKNENHG